jgi:hypothetical protein
LRRVALHDDALPDFRPKTNVGKEERYGVNQPGIERPSPMYKPCFYPLPQPNQSSTTGRIGGQKRSGMSQLSFQRDPGEGSGRFGSPGGCMVAKALRRGWTSSAQMRSIRSKEIGARSIRPRAA